MPLAYCKCCGDPYSVERSHAELRFTYCGVLCETADMVPISQLLLVQRVVKHSQLTEEEKEELAQMARDVWILEEAGG